MSKSSQQRSGAARGTAAASRRQAARGTASRQVIRDETLISHLAAASPASNSRQSSPSASPAQSPAKGRNSSTATSTANAAIIDWFACTVRPGDYAEAVGISRWLSQLLADAFGITNCTLLAKKQGSNGYTHCIDIQTPDGIVLGQAAHGGESQRGTVYLSLNGKGCARVADWSLVRAWGEPLKAKIKRLDLAHDDFEGRRVSVDGAVAWLLQGLCNTGGREPKSEVAGDWIRRVRGRTLYVGSRENGKLLRVYEKGKQLGDLANPWVRAEVEIHGTDRVIPWDALTRPGDYFAGSYPCFRAFSATPTRIATTQRAAQIEYEAMQRWVQQAAGGALYVMCKVEHGDPSAVMAKVIRDKVPKRLRSYPGFGNETSGEARP